MQEWNLLDPEQVRDFDTAVEALREQLDPGSKELAGQDFRHTTQRENESVADSIRHLERVFQVAYGHDKMAPEKRETILYGQLQEGLRLELIKSPDVSGAFMYKELCVSAENKERQQRELKKRQGYVKQSSQPSEPKEQVTNLAIAQRLLRRRDLLWNHATVVVSVVILHGTAVPQGKRAAGVHPVGKQKLIPSRSYPR